MYDYSGFINQILIVGGGIALLGLVILALSKFWNPIYRNKKYIVSSIIIIFIACIYVITMWWKMCNSIIDLYSGSFVEESRSVHSFHHKYIFETKSNEKEVFYLDAFSKSKIFDFDLEVGYSYNIFYDKSTKIIVKLEKIEPQ